MVHLTDVLGGTGWPNYITGYSFTPTISAGYYIALDFVPTSSGSIQFTTDPSYGNGGLISLSTVPGKFLPTDAGVICAYPRRLLFGRCRSDVLRQLCIRRLRR
jgi:hypothetical protein